MTANRRDEDRTADELRYLDRLSIVDLNATPGQHIDESPTPVAATALAKQQEEEYVHPDAARLFAACPWMTHIPLFGPSSKGLGPKCTVALSGCFFLNKGIGGYLVNYCRYAMFRSRFGIDGTRYQRLSTLRAMGWSVKAFSACISDTFALFGYTKRWYCAGSCIAGAAFALAFGLLPAKESSANTGAGFMFLTCFCMANIDIMSDGHYSRLLRKRPAAGPALVSWIWAFIFLASLVAAGIQGPLADAGIPQVALYISAACQVLTVFFFIFNWYGERTNRVERHEDVMLEAAEKRKLLAQENAAAASADAMAREPTSTLTKEAEPTSDGVLGEAEQGSEKLRSETALEPLRTADDDDTEDEVDQSSYITSLCCGAVEVNHEVFLRNWRLYVYSAVMVCAVVVQCVVTVYGSSHQLGWSSLAVALTCCGMAFWACSLVAAKAIVFVFLDMLLYLQLPGVMDSFYMAPKSCYPEGPHFTYVFYNTVGAIIGDIGGVCGVVAFSYIFSKRSYWVTFVVVTTIQVAASVFDIILVKRWNLAIGIPDHAMYILGDSIVFEVCYQMAWVPVVLLFARICPRGSESMIYALASGFSNMGQSISSAIGSLFIELVWPIKTKGVCDFSNVPMLLLVAHILLPLLIIPASILLLPRARICDEIDSEGRPVHRKPANGGAAATNSTKMSETAPVVKTHDLDDVPCASTDAATQGRKPS
ncbi:putative pteridine transporter [Novymonas esmeraldas]|uniref:Pteridine transporter n=1 Tax=Novymonas esmeraldas TaxID=1808958 RepID=A0AAW0EVG8_9TRYP